MIEAIPEPGSPWHSPERAWTPLMWIIRAVALLLSAMVLAPPAPLVVASDGVAAAFVAMAPGLAASSPHVSSHVASAFVH